MIELCVMPEVAGITWDAFVQTYGGHAIALDGFVYGAPKYEPRTRTLNLNHHEQVDRLATRATCAQVLMAIRQGLFSVFRDGQGPRAKVYVNDCDEDVCTSWFLLRNPALCENATNPLLNRLVAMEDALDATGGAYPFHMDMPVLRELAWVFEPYRQFRISGNLDKKNAAAYRSVIEDVYGRIGRHIVGQGDEIPIDTTYKVLGGGTGWTMVQETGAQARTGMFSAHIHAYVSVRERPNGRYTYVIGRMSQFIPFDLPTIFARLNEHEHCVESEDRWGGSETIGGSPRVRGSKLTPEEVTKIIETIKEA